MSGSSERRRFTEEVKGSMNDEQFAVFKECIASHQPIFCTGSAGVGKSWLLECIVKYFRSFYSTGNGRIRLAVTASTGISAFLIRGMTLHRFAGVGIEEEDFGLMLKNAVKGMSLVYWKETDILIIDEISMISPVYFENISRVGSHIRNDPRPFGGIRVMMFGDFLQLPPVSRNNNTDTRVFHTQAWKNLHLKVVQLTTIVRQTNSEFMDVLAGLRYGICTELAEEFIASLNREVKYDDGIEPVTLYAKRQTTDSFNEARLMQLPGNAATFTSTDSGNMSLFKQCPSPGVLNLKRGAQVILTRNMSDLAVNGSIGTVIGFETFGPMNLRPIVQFVLPDGSKFSMGVNRVKWEIVAPDSKILACRTQLPLLLAWALTIHRSQGQTIPRLRVDMEGIFEVGQTYVALSRCPNPENLQVANFDRRHVKASLSCVKFYQELARSIRYPPPNLPPAYIESQQLPDVEAQAAGAAATTQTWDNRHLLPSDRPPDGTNRDLPEDITEGMHNLCVRKGQE